MLVIWFKLTSFFCMFRSRQVQILHFDFEQIWILRWGPGCESLLQNHQAQLKNNILIIKWTELFHIQPVIANSIASLSWILQNKMKFFQRKISRSPRRKLANTQFSALQTDHKRHKADVQKQQELVEPQMGVSFCVAKYGACHVSLWGLAIFSCMSAAWRNDKYF